MTQAAVQLSNYQYIVFDAFAVQIITLLKLGLGGKIVTQHNIPLAEAQAVAQGTVKWFNQTKGYGFIEREGGDDLFVHISEVEGEIQDGDTVNFEVGEGPKGPNAVSVSKVE